MVTAREIIVDIPDDMPDVLADRTQLDQVITNLIENARSTGSGPDEVRVSARCDEGREGHGDDFGQR